MAAVELEGKHVSADFYRADIDGLRAVAVFLVILFHVGFSHFHGGFIGVDIFFVISGYLISTILLRDIERGTFSIAVFYERRIRRIFPVFLTVLAATTALAWHFYLPNTFVDYAKSLLATSLTISNIWLWRQRGYFDTTAAYRPLLHTWSLAVEEQFYIVFPLFLIAIYRYARKWITQVIFTITIISFVMSAVTVLRYPTATFYLVPTRAWELLLGTLISLKVLRLSNSKTLRNVAGLTGLALIGLSVVFLDDKVPFPGASALPTCMGAVLLILSGERRDTAVYRLLAAKPIMYAGLISYSLYLWHWPLIAFRGDGLKETLSLSATQTHLLILGETLILGVASWKFIETPFRTRFKMPRRRLFWSTGFVLLSVAVFALCGIRTDAFAWRFRPETMAVEAYETNTDPPSFREGDCFLTENHPGPLNQHRCLQPGDGQAPSALIIGSSQAAQYWWGLLHVFPKINFQQATAASCAPTIDQDAESAPFCKELMHFVFYEYLPAHPDTTVILSHSWVPEQLPALERTLQALQKRHAKVYVFGPLMEYDRPLPELLARQFETGKPLLREHLMPVFFQADAALPSLVARYPNITYVSIIGMLCMQRVCQSLAKPLVPLQGDGSHLNSDGSNAVAEKLRAAGYTFDPSLKIQQPSP